MSSLIMFEAVDFEVNVEGRTLTGVLLPFNEVSRPTIDPMTGMVARFRFTPDTIDLSEPSDCVLNFGHDRTSLFAQVGIATALTKTADGILAKFKVARTPEGDRVLALAEDKVLKAFSAEVDGEFEDDADGIQNSRVTSLVGAAVAIKPAFTGAQITHVAASAAPNGKEPVMGEENPQNEAPISFSITEGQALQASVQTLTEELAELKKIKIPVGPGAQFEVNEEPIYRFTGTENAPSGFDFATDLLAAAKDGDRAALDRVKKFTAQNLGPQFVDTGDTVATNQPKYRPDMFLGQAPVPTSPLYDTFYKGSLSDVTPFFWSKLDRANTDVSIHDHTEGVEPDADDIVTVSGATVTPTPVSGKVHITREVGDQGGNPQVSALIWAEFQRSFSMALENKTAALINAATIAELGAAIAAGANGAVAGQAIEAGLLGLQFLADGSRFTKAFGHVDLYTTLATYENSDGEKRYPIINPQNRDGIAGAKYSFLDIAGYRMEPAHSLGATTVKEKSIVADPNAVHVWNSGLHRLDKLQEDVEGWDLGCFAYFAGIVYDASGLRKITYDKTA